MNYAILDIETTGGSPKHEKITEIAILIHNGREVTDEFSTLINPEKTIPYFITGLTGITNEMVADAPRFYEVARKIVEITENCVIVGHNVNFDYSFIQNEFRQLGYDFQRKTLCTVKLSRKLLPGFKSYSLGKICEQLGIQINGRHRAGGDAYATMLLFERLMLENTAGDQLLIPDIRGRSGPKIPNGFLDPKQIIDLPASTGVYYLHDEAGKLIYVGKSLNIHDRVLSHLSNRKSRKSMEMADQTAGISFELTGSELIALLKESEEIKKFRPKYNRQQKRTLYACGLYSSIDKDGYIRFALKKTGKENSIPITSFENMTEARKVLGRLAERHWLCQKLCGLYETEGACFHYSIRQCNGACIGKEPKQVYNARARKLIEDMNYDHENMIIIDKGRNPEERSVVSIENGLYRGFGYIDISTAYLNLEDLLACIKPAEDNRDIRQIIRNWLEGNKVEKVIRW